MKVGPVLETCLYSTDLEAAERFYHDILGLEVHSRQSGRFVFFRCGKGMFLVFHPERSRLSHWDVPAHGSDGPGHVAFVVAKDQLESWRRRLSSYQVAVEKELVWPGGGRSLYFRDPAGNSVELATPDLWKANSE